MNTIRDLVVGEAELDDDDEGDESFDEETGEVRRTTNGKNRANGVNGHLDDSSEEEDDDDEEAAQAVESPVIWCLYLRAFTDPVLLRCLDQRRFHSRRRRRARRTRAEKTGEKKA